VEKRLRIFARADFYVKEILPLPFVNQTKKLAMQILTSSLGSKLSRLSFSFNTVLDPFPSYPQVWIDLWISHSFFFGLGLGRLSA